MITAKTLQGSRSSDVGTEMKALPLFGASLLSWDGVASAPEARGSCDATARCGLTETSLQESVNPPAGSEHLERQTQAGTAEGVAGRSCPRC